MKRVGIVGATGYVGAELLRLLLNHKEVEVVALGSVSFEGKEISEIYPNFYSISSLVCKTTEEVIAKSDIIFTALPHGLSEEIAELALKDNKICIDLGADFRLSNEEDYKKWYGKEFDKPSLHKDAVYGLPELNYVKISESNLIANPGCYPTSIELALYPLLKNRLIKLENIICDSKSGATGAGRGLTLKTHFTELNGSFSAYNIGGHRHTPEIEETLSFMAGEKVSITFTPHLLPINRGILSTIYCTPTKELDLDQIYKLYKSFYENMPFVTVLPLGQNASTKNIRFTNNCHISLHKNHRGDGLIITSAIDNMIKGAAGQAIQNMNIRLGFKETEGLCFIAPAF